MTSAPLDGLRGELHVLPSADEVARAAAGLVQRIAADAARRGPFSIALAGGNTPRLLYQELSGEEWRGRVDWSTWRVYFGDERAVPPDDDASNFRMAREALLDQVPIDPAHVHRMEGELPDLDAAARDYSTLLEATLPRGDAGAPRLDCILLGLGENGHTASLFPGTEALSVAHAWATRGRADYAPFDRITLTYPALNAAAVVMFLVTGETKRDAVRATAAGITPAAGVQPHDGTLHWILDRAASGR